jgi:pimeloyl-ACP methyl ester carboxylesterase
MAPNGPVDVVVSVLDFFGVAKAHLVGSDWGGGIAYCTALHRPHRVAQVCVSGGRGGGVGRAVCVGLCGLCPLCYCRG